MTLGLVFVVIGLVWLPFRKWVAHRQYFISSRMLGRSSIFSKSQSEVGENVELYEERVRGFEMLGVFFCSVMIVGGLLIVMLTLIFRPPWAVA